MAGGHEIKKKNKGARNFLHRIGHAPFENLTDEDELATASGFNAEKEGTRNAMKRLKESKVSSPDSDKNRYTRRKRHKRIDNLNKLDKLAKVPKKCKPINELQQQQQQQIQQQDLKKRKDREHQRKSELTRTTSDSSMEYVPWAGSEFIVEMRREDPEEPVGMKLEPNLAIASIQSDTIFYNKATPGNIIISVNGTRPDNVDDFYKRLTYAVPETKLVLRHGENAPRQPTTDIQRQLIKEFKIRASGYAHFIVPLKWVKEQDRKLGLHIQQVDDRVYIAGCDQDSITDDYLRRLDRIIAVDDIPALKKNATKAAILAKLKNPGELALIIERPLDEDKRQRIECKMQDASDEIAPSSVQLPADVIELASRERERRRQLRVNLQCIDELHPVDGENVAYAIQSILRTSADTSSNTNDNGKIPGRRQIELTNKPPIDVYIQRDTHAGKKLRPVGDSKDNLSRTLYKTDLVGKKTKY